jgi:hypothetical protein
MSSPYLKSRERLLLDLSRVEDDADFNTLVYTFREDELEEDWDE